MRYYTRIHYTCILFILLLFLLIFQSLSLVSAKESEQLLDLSVYDELTLDLRMAGSFDVIKHDGNPTLKSVDLNLMFYPYHGHHQQVLQVNATRPYEVIDTIYDKGFQFHWYGFEHDTAFEIFSRMNVKNKALKVTNKVPFPVLDLPEDAKVYLKETSMIDYRSNGIQQLASKLVAGENDMYVVVFTLADWVRNNIKYDLNTVTAEAALPASWVLDNKQGVCDEMTNLFIAMLRSVGVPARFVTGISYTTSDLFSQPWGPHGWAEVYFPGAGWVPFDVTYGQYGFLDATHIKLKHSIDSNKSSVEYSWTGRDVSLALQPLSFNVSVVGYGKLKKDEDLSVLFDIEHDNVKIGSYNLVKAVLKNKQNYYYPVNLRLQRSEKITVLDKEERAVLLRPGEEKTVYWIVRVDEHLDRDYQYTFTMRLNMIGRAPADVTFTADKQGVLYVLSDVDAVVTATTNAEEKSLTRYIHLTCQPEKEKVYHGQRVSVSCIVKNSGNTLQENIAVCLLNSCKTLSLGIGEEQQITLLYDVNDVLDDLQLEVTARNAAVLSSSFITLRVVDKPSLEITDLIYPTNVSSTTSNLTLSFTLQKDSVASPRDVAINVNYGKKTFAATLPLLDNSLPVSLVIDPHDLLFEHNIIPLIVTYTDDDGASFTIQEELVITYVPEKVEESFLLWINKMLVWITGLFG